MLSFLLDFLFPKYCLVTGKPGEILSAEGKKRLVAHPEMCPVSHNASSDFVVLPPYRSQIDYEGCMIAFTYTPEVKKCIFKLKYDHRYTVAEFLVDRLILIIQSNSTFQKKLQNSDLIITSVPSHRRRKYVVKGYNQSELLAKLLAKKLDASYVPLVQKTKHTSSQAKLSRTQRQKNLNNVFKILPDISLPKNSLVLIVDDIFTTGTTLQKISETIKNSFPSSKIWGVMVAHNA